MEQNVLSMLNDLNGENKVTLTERYFNVEIGGEILIERGSFKGSFEFSARLFESRHKGYICLDEFDVHITNGFDLGGIPIDDLDKFKNQLSNWGIGKKLTEKLGFSRQEQEKAILLSLSNSSRVKQLFGKNVKFLDLLSVEEGMYLDLKYLIDNFKDQKDSYLLGLVGEYYGLGKNPTIDELKLKLIECK